MRVVHIVDRLDAVGGVQTYLQALLPALRACGVEGTVFSPDEGTPTFGGAEVVPVAGLDADGPALPRGGGDALRGALRRVAPEVVLVHIAPSPQIVTVAGEFGRPILWVHDYLPVCPGNARYLHTSASFCAEGPGTRCFVRAYSERCSNRRPDRLLRATRRVRAWGSILPAVDRVLVASPFMADVVADAGVPVANLSVVGYPIDHARERASSKQPVADVVFVGRLVASKGVDVLLRALATLPGRTAVVAGDGPARPALEALAQELGLGERVRFLGWVTGADARAQLFDEARVVSLPSLWQEPFGIVGLEALAAGVPVVASEVGGIPSWLSEGQGGLLVPARDHVRLAAALERVLSDESLRRELGARGRTAAGRFSMEQHLRLVLPQLAAGGR